MSQRGGRTCNDPSHRWCVFGQHTWLDAWLDADVGQITSGCCVLCEWYRYSIHLLIHGIGNAVGSKRCHRQVYPTVICSQDIFQMFYDIYLLCENHHVGALSSLRSLITHAETCKTRLDPWRCLSETCHTYIHFLVQNSVAEAPRCSRGCSSVDRTGIWNTGCANAATK